MEMFCGFVRRGSYSFDCKFTRKIMVFGPTKHNHYPYSPLFHPFYPYVTLILPLFHPLFYPYFQTHTEDSKEYIQQMAALRGVSVADYVIMTGGPTRLIKAFFPAQPLLIPNL